MTILSTLATARGARFAAGAVVLMSGINTAFLDTGWGTFAEFLLGLIFGAVALLVFAPVVAVALRLIRTMPELTGVLLLASLAALYFLFENSPASLLRSMLDRQSDFLPDAPQAYSAPMLLLLLLCIFGITAVLVALRRWQEAQVPLPRRYALVGTGAVLGFVSLQILAAILGSGYDPYPGDGATPAPLANAPALADPGLPGAFAVEKLSYGAGPNPRRPEFGRQRSLESRTVDARPLLPEWKDFKQSMRENYWGFGLAEAPLNGLVWAPQGDGPFPLVLIVHGNHGMEDYSDAGYAYLGELLASRGFLVVSVDQNYINGSWSGDFQGKEMAARGWLLLEHLALWRDWNASDDHPFAGRVDMQQIALIGHSRGGEAVSIAAAFNQLPRFPDDATVNFDYGFAIRSLVAIAQVDQRYHRRVKLADINFFTIHGSYDSDEPAYHGLRQMNRLRFSGAGNYLKAGAYLHGANHGQFNSDWGRYDYGFPGAWRLNTSPIIPGEEQRQAARVYISAFLEATLHEQRGYRRFLKDPRQGASWLPRRTFVAQYQESSFRALANFEEDLDVTTATFAGATLSAEGLSLWREQPLLHRDKRPQGSQAVYLGWEEPGASLTLNLKTPLVLRDRSLVLAVAATPDLPSDGSQENPTIADFSVELVDRRGVVSRLPVAEFAQLVPPVRVQYLKNAAANKASYNANWEPVLQHVEIPTRAFAADTAIDLSDIAAIRLVFDRASEGTLIVDTIGSAAAAPE